MADKTIAVSESDKPAEPTIWDNDLPTGDSPPLPRWPLTVSIVAVCVWTLFMVAMVVSRFTSGS